MTGRTIPRVRTLPVAQARLDRLPNPFGPIEPVIDAIIAAQSWNAVPSDLADLLRVRLAAQVGVASNWIVLANGIDELHAMITRWRASKGPIVLFPPTDPGFESWIGRHAEQIERVRRGRDFALPVGDRFPRLPSGATAVVMSPNDPTGTVVTVQEIVRLSRAVGIVVIDERHAAYSPRTLIPLAREFDNLIVTQTFETYAGLSAFPLAWAIAPPRLAAEIAELGRPSGLAHVALVAALAALDHDEAIRRTVRQVMIEKGRLFRQLRKLSMISPPYSSWANFLLARFERGTSAYFMPRLAERGIHVFPVANPELPNHVRISAVSMDATNALKQALIDIAIDI